MKASIIKKALKKVLPFRIRVIAYRFIGVIYKLVNYCRYIKVKFSNKSDSYFEYNNEKFKYYIAFYNTTWTNERMIEIPIILDYIDRFRGKKILEIGNVISHYEKVKYDILDKYEKSDGVINSDIIDYKPRERYDLIVSISTFEHIGFDEVVRYGENKNIYVDQASLFNAVNNTKELLNENGVFVFTAPLGFNNFFDSQLENNKLELSEMHFLKRSPHNKWIQVKYNDIIGIKYNDPYPCANGLVVGIYKKKGE